MAEVIAKVISGEPSPLSQNEVMELGAKCSSEGFPLQKLIDIAVLSFLFRKHC